MMKKAVAGFLTAAGMLVLGACTTIDKAPSPVLERDAVWAVLPMVNHTEAPQAALKAEAITEALLRNRGVKLKRYPASMSRDSLFEPSERKLVDEALAWARTEGTRYALTGAVEEWRYKVGIDGEPAVGITLQLLDVTSGEVLWNSAGGKTGWSRQGLAAVAQKLLKEMLANIRLG